MINRENFNKYNLYIGEKNNKFKNEIILVILVRCLLRIKRILVLFVYINIIFIILFYDVVYFWFVLGLGLKIDCVLGRFIYYILYIDNIGFYYG